MKKTLLFLCLMCMLGGCGEVTQEVETESMTVEQEVVVAEDIFIVGDTKEDVTFLTSEQMELVEDGFAYMEAMTMSIGWLPQKALDGSGDNAWMGEDFVEINGWNYIPYTDNFYTDWNVFYTDFTSILTPEYFKELNTNFDDDVEYQYYENVEDMLYYMPADRGSHILYMGNDMLRYELIEAEETEIIFNLIGYYCDFEDLENEDGKVARTMERHTVVLQNTADGWRIASFDLPY
ncbi:hypothetical protein [Chakrabartyella piscis]|uniref:hypothetical protein n=1 Tax=Chakrabartyella piscis TaxID=2918914 RepID=UPI0029587F34|nr:hypothetical protein [Chakrabartyella piscis]